MITTMTQQQIDAYMEKNGYGISSENGNVAYISDKNGNVVAMFWRGKENYLETLDEPVRNEEVDIDSQADALIDAIKSGALAVTGMTLAWVMICIFG